MHDLTIVIWKSCVLILLWNFGILNLKLTSDAQETSIDYSCRTCRNGGLCHGSAINPYYYDSTYNYNNLIYCKKCECPYGYGGHCCDVFVDPCTVPGACDDNHTCNSYQNLTYSCDCPPGKKGPNCEEDIGCDNNLCREYANCTADPSNKLGYVCDCSEMLDGVLSGTYCEKLSTQLRFAKCTATYCKNGGICFEDGLFLRSCKCPPGTSGPTCGTLNPCFDPFKTPCKNNGQCVPGPGTEYTCDCLDVWNGDDCTDYNICNNRTNPCRNGICEPTGDKTYSCTCDVGFTGSDCEVNINDCVPNPCKHGSRCIDGVASYSCSCIRGVTGKHCEVNIDDCGKGKPVRVSRDRWFVPTHCNKVDVSAGCNDLIDGYDCECSPQYTDTNCTLNMVVWKAIQALGDDMELEDLIALLTDITEKPSLIKDMLPFMLALMPEEDQIKMGYNYEDIFEWASYERTELQSSEIKQWYETTLGNCFSFNAPEYSNYSIRYAGIHGGFRAMLRVGLDEYLSWIDTEGLSVFIHDPTVAVFGESIRYTVAPGHATSVSVKKTSYRRLDGKYGVCVKDLSEIGSYYYGGAYTTDGCLRSCYQDKVESACGCMDPRYPSPEDATLCPLNMRGCVLNVTEELGDPSRWPECYCPLPCEEVQYDVGYSTAEFSSVKCGSYQKQEEKEHCLENTKDYVVLEVFFPKITQQTFVETPKTGVTTFIGYIGGLLGCLTGISIISLIEFGYLIYRVIHAFIDRSGYHVKENVENFSRKTG